MALSKQEVDVRVQMAVENLQAGRGVEDDAGIELKGDWPEPAAKARQLAGAANALRGEPLVYVIGVDDKTGQVTVPTKTEPQAWYAKVRKRFDQLAPELLWVQTVSIGDSAESVLALVFSTDEFPYVINAENRREVPLRVATGTESAHRNQLVRMFEPKMRTPLMSVTEATARARAEDTLSTVKDGTPDDVVHVLSLEITLFARVFVEHTGPLPATLPVRDMKLRIVCADFETRPEVRVKHLGESVWPVITKMGDAPPPEPVPPQHGVYARDKHVVAISPGEFSINTRMDFRKRVGPDPAHAELVEVLGREDAMRLDFAFRIVGVEHPVKVSATLMRTEAMERSVKRSALDGDDITLRLGTWELVSPDTDPWGAEEGS